MAITRQSIAREYREIFDDEKSYGAWSRGGNNQLSDSEYRHIAYGKAFDRAIPAYAWPGGYDMGYYIEGEYDLTGDVLCADCARSFVKANKDAKLHAECLDGYEGNDSADHLYCDDCHKIICRAWCRDKGHRDDRELAPGEWERLRLIDLYGESDTWTTHSRSPHRRSFMRSRYTPKWLRPVRTLHAARPELTRYGGRKVAV